MTDVQFFSRRNNVVLRDNNGAKVIVKRFVRDNDYISEVDVLTQYASYGYFPELLEHGDNIVVKQYVGNTTLLDCLEQCNAEDTTQLETLLCNAVDMMVHFNSNSGLIFYDVNFANFVVGDRLYFVDVEQCATGSAEQDLSLFLAFLTTYDIKCQDIVSHCYNSIVRHITSIDPLLADNVLNMVDGQVNMLIARRKK